MLHCFHLQYFTEYSNKTMTTTTLTRSITNTLVSAWSLRTLSAPLCDWPLSYEVVTLDLLNFRKLGSVTFSICEGSLVAFVWTPLVGRTGSLWAVMAAGSVVGGEVVCCIASDWLTGQIPTKLLHNAPQCCSHCPRSRRPTHVLTLSPHFSRKFISST